MEQKYCFKEFVSDINKLPNWLTFSRIVGFFFLLYPLLSRNNLPISFVVFILLAMTDFIDGELARRKNIVSWLGKGLDPAADKILLMGTLFAIGFLKVYPILGLILVILESALFTIGIAVFLRKDERLIFGANMFGKIKVVLEVAVIFFVFFDKLRFFRAPQDLILFVFLAAICAAIMSVLGHLGLLDAILYKGDAIP